MQEQKEYVKLAGPIVDVNYSDGRAPTSVDIAPYAKIFGGRPALAWNAMAL